MFQFVVVIYDLRFPYSHLAIVPMVAASKRVAVRLALLHTYAVSHPDEIPQSFKDCTCQRTNEKWQPVEPVETRFIFDRPNFAISELVFESVGKL